MKNLITTLMLISSFVFAQIPQTVSFQGYLSDSNGEPISDGNYEVTFRLFDSLTEGNNVWEETMLEVKLNESGENETNTVSNFSLSGSIRELIKRFATKIYDRIFTAF